MRQHASWIFSYLSSGERIGENRLRFGEVAAMSDDFPFIRTQCKSKVTIPPAQERNHRQYNDDGDDQQTDNYTSNYKQNLF